MGLYNKLHMAGFTLGIIRLGRAAGKVSIAANILRKLVDELLSLTLVGGVNRTIGTCAWFPMLLLGLMKLFWHQNFSVKTCKENSVA